MNRPAVRDLDWLRAESHGSAVLRASASVADRMKSLLPCPAISSIAEIPAAAQTLIVAGGGTLMDEAKYFRVRQRPAMKLVLVPSIWGSGAEVSPIVVRNGDSGKEIATGAEFLPDAVVYLPELMATVPAARARHACGDAWTHAIEAFFSPLASETLRYELAALIAEMLNLPLAADPRWFQAGARACALQAQASVGLVHGIAHVLEPALRAQYPSVDWGHAKLCSIFLLPVMHLNRAASPKWDTLTRAYGIDPEATARVAESLFEPAAFAAALPLLRENWSKILRDPCTRTNGALVRGRHLECFEGQAAA